LTEVSIVGNLTPSSAFGTFSQREKETLGLLGTFS
jgi:hypothetical protein